MMVSRQLVAILPTFDEIKWETSWRRPAYLVATMVASMVATMVAFMLATMVASMVATMVAFIVFKLQAFIKVNLQEKLMCYALCNYLGCPGATHFHPCSCNYLIPSSTAECVIINVLPSLANPSFLCYYVC